jgi:hypothetical protein
MRAVAAARAPPPAPFTACSNVLLCVRPIFGAHLL